MDIKNEKWDQSKKERVSRRNKWEKEDLIKYAEKVQNDEKREQRLKAQNCKLCFYHVGKLGFQAMTRTNCGKCDTEVWYGSSVIDNLCENCAKEENCCKHCGGEID